MPNIKSAKKRARSSSKRQERNYTTRSKVKTSMRKVLDLLKAGKVEEAETALKKAYKDLDTAAKKNVLHKNAAARKKSSLAKKVSKEKTGKK